MPVVSTDEWLFAGLKDSRSFLKKVTSYFPNESPREALQLLSRHGMFRIGKESEAYIELFIKQDAWKTIKRSFIHLQKTWSGPDIPILIFPADRSNLRIRKEFNGKSGVAFSDKLFLFLAETVEPEEMRSVFTHEYHHVCRLRAIKKKEEELTLLDSIVMEGLAEHAVKEHVGPTYAAPWTTYYTRRQATEHWEKYIKPNSKVKKNERKHDELLYGGKWYPRLLGYNTGYHIVMSYAENHSCTSRSLLSTSAEHILKGSSFTS